MSKPRAAVKGAKGDKSLSHAPERLRRRRIAAGMSMTRLAQAAGYSKSHLSEVEGGHTSASPECLRELARVLGCEITDLMPAEDAAEMTARQPGNAA